MSKTILIVGTYDTKDDELRFVEGVIKDQGGQTQSMDVSVLKDPKSPVDISKHDVAAAAGKTIDEVIALGDENHAMQAMATGASTLASRLRAEGKIDGVIILGGTMGTDLALDICNALPIGVPKYIVSTVSFSPLLPPERIPADVQMILWAGGLYGLNAICKSSLSQAAGAVLGAAKAVHTPDLSKPMVGMTSFGKTIMRYMVDLKPALEERGFEVAVFHATGMGGRAFEDLAAQGRFVCVMDFAIQEVVNHAFGSFVSAGPDRLTAAGRMGIPQIVGTGCNDLIDIVGWHTLDPRWQDYPTHAHNRLISSIVLGPKERAEIARTLGKKLSAAKGPTALMLPLRGSHEWEREGEELHDAEGIAAFNAAMIEACPDAVKLHQLDAHINDPEFVTAVLDVFDGWCETGVVQVVS
ncbi:MAG: Tm-1-like ATP-binding domain-containing protein [Pseudomonadota bacterium]